METDNRGFISAGQTDNGMYVWCKRAWIDDTKYLRVEYRDKDDKLIMQQKQYPVSHIKDINTLIELLDMEYGSYWSNNLR